MNKITSILLFFVIATGASQAQNSLGDIEFIFGKKIENQKGTFIQIIGETADTIYALGLRGKKKYYINTFSSGEMSLLSNELIVIPREYEKNFTFEDIRLVGEKLFLIGSHYNRKKKESNLIVMEVSPDGKLIGKEKILFSINVNKHSERGRYYFRSSQDKQSLLVMHVSVINKYESIQYQIKLLDENMEVALDHTEKIPYDHKYNGHSGIDDFKLGPSNDVFIAINGSHYDRNLKKYIENFLVHSFKKNNDYKKEVLKPSVPGKVLLNCRISVNFDNILQLVGFYAELSKDEKTMNSLKGIYNININTVNNTVVNQKFNDVEFGFNLLTFGDRSTNNNKNLSPLYTINNIISRSDGGIIVFSEYQTIHVKSNTHIGPLNRSSIKYNSNEIIITSFDYNGDLEWNNVVPKEQSVSSTVLSIGGSSFKRFRYNVIVGSGLNYAIAQMGKGPEYIGYIPIYKNGNLTILFNDNEKNIGKTDMDKITTMTRYNLSIPTAFQIDKHGKMTRADPEEAAKDQLIMRPNVFLRKSDNELIIFTSRRNEERLSRMTIGI